MEGHRGMEGMRIIRALGLGVLLGWWVVRAAGLP